MNIAHGRAVAVASMCWLAGALALWPVIAQAAPLSTDVKGFDWASVGYAAALGLLGGGLQLIVALASDQRVVLEVLAEGARNALVSPITGVAAYLAVEIATSVHAVEPLPPIARFAVIVIAGWAGIAAYQWARDLVVQMAAGLKTRALAAWAAWRAVGAGNPDQP